VMPMPTSTVLQFAMSVVATSKMTLIWIKEKPPNSGFDLHRKFGPSDSVLTYLYRTSVAVLPLCDQISYPGRSVCNFDSL
jgi:hypothetical protein